MTTRDTAALDPFFVALAEQVAAAGLPPISESDVDVIRARVEAGDATQRPGPDCGVEDLEVGDPAVPVRVYTPRGGVPGAVLYAHGGGWVLGGLGYGDEFCRLLADSTGRVVISVDYRRAPEHRYPAALDDCWSAYQWALQTHGGTAGVAVAGDSAGGILAAALCHRAARSGAPMPRAQILLYPVLDHTMSTDSYAENANGPLLTAGDMAWFWEQYVPEPEDRREPEASPSEAQSLAGHPPALVVACGFDPLYGEAVDYADRLSRAGVRVTLREEATMPHGYVRFSGLAPSVAEATDAVVEEAATLLR